MNRVSRRQVLAVALLCAIILIGTSVTASNEVSLESGMRSLARTIHLGMAIASIGSHAPTLADSRLLAQRLVNLLEGVDGEHYVSIDESTIFIGMIPGIARVSARCESHGLAPEVLDQVAVASRNVSTYLQMALESALGVLDVRGLERATRKMLAAYAYLATVCETTCETACDQDSVPLVPALPTMMRLLGIGPVCTE